MFRFFLILLLCALFAACSSDDSATLKEWFDYQGIKTSYSKDDKEIEVSLKDFNFGYDSSAYDVVNSYTALGNANNVEQILYFGLDSLSSDWNLRTDSTFYADFNGSGFPETIDAKFCWLADWHDSLWLKFPEFTDCKDITLKWKAGTSRDTFNISFPDELKIHNKLLASIRIANDAVLRIAKPSTSDIPGLSRIAQKTYLKREGSRLYAGARDSLNVVFEIGKDKIKIGKTVVFAQLVLPKSSDATGNELGHPLPVYVYSDGSLEDYRVDSVFVKDYGHPNLVFWEGDTLKLQVTKKLRNYVNAANSPDILGFTLRLGTPMLIPRSLYFYNSIYSSEKVFSDRPAYASYDFSTAFAEGKAKLRLWYAETD